MTFFARGQHVRVPKQRTPIGQSRRISTHLLFLNILTIFKQITRPYLQTDGTRNVSAVRARLDDYIKQEWGALAFGTRNTLAFLRTILFSQSSQLDAERLRMEWTIDEMIRTKRKDCLSDGPAQSDWSLAKTNVISKRSDN